MRRFLRAHRDEDYSHIQYLTSKCVRLAHEKAALEREYVISRERETALKAEVESLSMQLRQKEQGYQELSLRHAQLLETLQNQRGLAQFLQQRVVSLAEENSRETTLLSLQLEQVSSDLQQLHTSETRLQGLVDELCQEAQDTVKKAEGLETKLRKETQLSSKQKEDLQRQLESKSEELEELQMSHSALQQELSEQQSAHQRSVTELQQKNEGSLQKLREMAEQFEWLCEQQRNWMCCVKRFKDCLSDEKESLILQVNRLQDELAELRKNQNSEKFSSERERSLQHSDSWEIETMKNLQVDADRWRGQYEELFGRLTSHQGQENGQTHQKPP